MSVSSANIAYVAGLLAPSDLFADLGPELLAEAARIGRVLSLSRGEALPRLPGRRQPVFVVAEGVIIEAARDEVLEREALVSVIGARSAAGLEAAMADGQELASSTLMALSNVVVVSLPRDGFRTLVDRQPLLQMRVMSLLAVEARRSKQDIARSVHRTLEARLATMLARIAALLVTDAWDPVAVAPRLAQAQLAELLGVSREHLNRTLSVWERSGLIGVAENGDIVVANRRRLEAIAARGRPDTPNTDDNSLVWEIDVLIDLGLNQAAYNLAIEAARRNPRELRFKHRAVLAAARQGGLQKALSLIETFDFAADVESEEIACLKPRLLRDLAFSGRSGDTPDPDLISQSAAGYEQAFRLCKGSYSGLNASASAVMAGQLARGQALAAEALAAADEEARQASENDAVQGYWSLATRAECRLILGDLPAATAIFAQASRAQDVTPGKRAATRIQLARLARPLGLTQAWIDANVRRSDVLYFAGPMATDTEGAGAACSALQAHIDHLIAANPIAYAVGPLAAGADIIIAERLIAAGVKLQVHLPTTPRLFHAQSVAPWGETWSKRFSDCMRSAQEIHWNWRGRSSEAGHMLGALCAMGRTRMLARDLQSTPMGVFCRRTTDLDFATLTGRQLKIWRASPSAFSEFQADWPSPSSANGETQLDDIVFAAIVADARTSSLPVDPPALRSRHSIDASTEVFLFDNPEEALQFAARTKDTRRVWLDAAVVADAQNEIADALLCIRARPVSELRTLYASEVFATAAVALNCSMSFEYAGYLAMREKSHPCPMFLVLG